MRRIGGGDTVFNLVLLCIPCHRELHRDESSAAEYGFVAWGDPEFTPLFHAREGWVLLAPDGTFEHLSEHEAVRLLAWLNGVQETS